jgi:hypothetical protein
MIDDTQTLAIGFPTEEIVRQHNAMINSPFNLASTEWRLFTCILARIRPTDTEFAVHVIPVSEFMDLSSSNWAYEYVRDMKSSLAGRTLQLEIIPETGKRSKSGRTHRDIPLFSLLDYVEGKGCIEAQLNHQVMPYLLELTRGGQFTRSVVQELKSLKSSYAHKLYWLLSEYRFRGERTFTYSDLRYRLGMNENEYADRFNNFKARIIDKVQLELARTDLAFTYQVLRTGKKATGIVFRYSARPIPLDPASSATKTVLEADILPTELVEQLRAIGVSQDSIAELTRDACETKRYPVDYIWYVLNKSKQNVKTKIKSVGGWVFKLVRNRSLLDEYERSLKAPAAAPVKRPNASGAPAGKKGASLAEVAAQEGWRKCLPVLEQLLGAQSISTWLKPLQPLSFQDGVLELGVPDQRIYEHIEATYVAELAEALNRVFGPGIKLEYSVTLARS